MGMFGLSTPLNYPTQQQTPWGINPYLTQGQGISPFGLNPFQTNPFLTQQYGQGIGSSHLQQIVPQLVQVLQVVPQQLQQLQQILQFIPQQLQQLQQLIQILPQQIQQLQGQQQPFGQFGLGGFQPWGLTPQSLGGQTGHVM